MKNLKSIFLLAIMFIACQTVFAQFDKGVEYYKKGDYGNAAKCFQQAAEQGDANAQCNLGAFYLQGLGVPKNLQEAVKWYRKAADQGNASAQCNLAGCYENGIGVTKNFQEAVKWYQKAAEQGHAKSKYFLGLCYYRGRGVTRDIQKAKSLFTDAAYDGFDEAKEMLDNMRTADADRRGNALKSAYIRKYGKRAAAAMDKCQPYVGMSEGALRDFAFASQDGNFNPFLFQGVIGAYKIYKPNGYLRILNAGYNLHLRYPSVVYVRNGRVSALKW